MSRFGARDHDGEALSALSREAASQALPALDWERIESRLFERIGRDAGPAHDVRGSRSRWGVLATAFAAAAMAVFVAHGGRPPSSRLGPAAAGEWLRSGATPLGLHEEGLVDLRLSPSSELRIVSRRPGQSMSVALESGSMHADVVPGHAGEAFAVEVGRTRVAVHGTSFSVTRSGGEVIVAVERGSVAVGSLGRPGETQGWIVVAPERAAFSLDGASSARWLEPVSLAPPPAPPAAFEPKPATGAARAPSPAAARPAPPAVREQPAVEAPPAVPEPQAVESPQAPAEPEPARVPRPAAATTILLGVRRCYERQLSASNVEFSVHSTLTLRIAADGTIEQGVFTPPLSPTLMACATQELGAVRFEHSSAPSERRVTVDLSPPARAE